MAGALKWFAYLTATGLTLIGILFIIAAYANTIRLIEGVIFIVIALTIIYLTRERKPIEIKKTVTVTGPIKVKEINCPNCNAIVNPEKIQVFDGKPYITCDYCENKFEITEDPTW